ncbi:peroxiredoxin family protein [Stratiformator vulcanicus]|uniref:Thiol-disulfide oxidoreductase ResA n=1 Tax=Stratiformator vulcanicus TaxID=2527980 RepID=A0A517R4W4_9PLAN|nr:TlpA disulfide reductase family protein [Stratiformator vulcanicus]QDT38929.1 Thiol-disulfide oxidoreductase ResA [Stratiformator vulcanicus]
MSADTATAKPDAAKAPKKFEVPLALVAILIAAGAIGYFAAFVVGRDSGIDGGLAVGEVAPELTAAGWLNGEPQPVQGNVTVVNGWFYNCPHCWTEAPELAALSEQFEGRSVQFVGLSPEAPESIEQVKDFVAKNGLKYPNGYGAIPTLQAFEVRAFPALWVLDRDGTVIWNRSLEHRESLEDAINRALAKS